MNTTYKANIEFTAYKDDYTEGEDITAVNSWYETLEANTKDELKQKILDATYTDKWENVSDEQINEYEHATEYFTEYTANGENDGNASASEIEQWKKGELDLYAIHCHILVTEAIEQKTVL